MSERDAQGRCLDCGGLHAWSVTNCPNIGDPNYHPTPDVYRALLDEPDPLARLAAAAERQAGALERLVAILAKGMQDGK